MAGFPEVRGIGARLRYCGSTRETGPGTILVEQTLEGKKPRRAPTRRSCPGQGTGSSRERTPGGSKASKRACRPLTGEPDEEGTIGLRRHTQGCVQAVDLAVARKPSSRLMRLGSPPGGPQAKSWRGGESDRENPGLVAPAAVEREPARKKRPARAGTAPREGKALKGNSKGTRAA